MWSSTSGITTRRSSRIALVGFRDCPSSSSASAARSRSSWNGATPVNAEERTSSDRIGDRAHPAAGRPMATGRPHPRHLRPRGRYVASESRGMRRGDPTTGRRRSTAVRVRAACEDLSDECLRTAIVLGPPDASAFVLRRGTNTGFELDLAPGVVHERFKSEATLVPTFQGRYDVVRGTKHERDLRAFLERVHGMRADRDDALVLVHDPDLRGHDSGALEAEPREHVFLEDAPRERHDQIVSGRQHCRLVNDRLGLTPKRTRVLADLRPGVIELTLEVMLAALHAKLVRFRRSA